MLVYRAGRRPRAAFDPLDSSASVARDGWRFNDKRSEILYMYTAQVQALSILEVAARPGWDTVTELTIAGIEVSDGSVLDLSELGIILPSNWNVRPAAPNAQSIGGEFLAAVDREAAAGRRVFGVRAPSTRALRAGYPPNLNLLASRYSSSSSIPTHRRPRRSATAPAVFDPANGSTTTSPSPVSSLTKNSGSAAGKRAG